MGFSKKDFVRIKKTKTNTTVALVTSIAMGVASFLERMIFNQVFISDYLGLYSFFNSTINILSILQVGLPASIAYALYAPIDEGNEDQIWAIMHLFKRAYQIIGTLILLIGIILLPFLHIFVKTEIPIGNVRIYYLLYLLANVFNYYLMYTSVLITANQEEYKVTLITNGSWTIMYIVQITITLFTKNYLLYSFALFAFNIIRALMIRHVAKKDYPYLWKKKKVELNQNIKERIVKNIKGLMSSKFASAIVSSTDSILISTFIGTAILGKYSNYQMITDGVRQVSMLLPRAVSASVGNIGVSESRKKISQSFETLSLSSFLIYGPLTILLLSITNSIINVFFAGRVLPISSVIIIYINFYLVNMREILLTYKGSLGLYYEDRIRPIIEATTNLILSIVMGYFWGFNGILGATAITNLCVNLLIEPRIIFHEGLKRSAFWYYLSAFLRFILVAATAALVLFINSLLSIESNLLRLIIETLIAVAIILAVFFIAYRRNPSSKIILKTLKVAFKKDKKK